MFESAFPFQYLQTSLGNFPVLKEHSYSFYTGSEKYIVLLHEFENNFFGIKFYPYNQKKNPYKYNIITNKNTNLITQKIIRSCVDVMQYQLTKNPLSSFGFVGVASIVNGIKEQQYETQRFDIYSRIMPLFFKTNLFTHLDYVEQSAYLIFNKSNNINTLEDIINDINLHYEIFLEI